MSSERPNPASYIHLFSFSVSVGMRERGVRMCAAVQSLRDFNKSILYQHDNEPGNKSVVYSAMITVKIGDLGVI